MKERNRREREIASLDAHEQAWEAARQPRGVDAPARLVLGHAEPAHAELEHRWACSFEMETALFHLDEVCEQPREHHATLAAERLQILEELRVGEIGELHASVLHREFLRPWAPHARAIGRERLPAVWRARRSEGTATSAQRCLLAWTSARQRDRAPRIASTKISIEMQARDLLRVQRGAQRRLLRPDGRKGRRPLPQAGEDLLHGRSADLAHPASDEKSSGGDCRGEGADEHGP